MKIIVGLGNPGSKYEGTRHNAGFLALDCLANRLNASFSKEKYGAIIAETRHSGDRLLLMKPMTFMNNSGLAIARAMRYTGAMPEDVLVLVDDVHLPLGRLRLRANGSAGGHNGLKSIIAHLGTQEFPRIRMGVGAVDDGGQLVRHVLGKFRVAERPEIERMTESAADAAIRVIEAGIERAMNEFN